MHQPRGATPTIRRRANHRLGTLGRPLGHAVVGREAVVVLGGLDAEVALEGSPEPLEGLPHRRFSCSTKARFRLPQGSPHVAPSASAARFSSATGFRTTSSGIALLLFGRFGRDAISRNGYQSRGTPSDHPSRSSVLSPPQSPEPSYLVGCFLASGASSCHTTRSNTAIACRQPL